MPNSCNWCGASASFRLEWRPSRWLVGALVLIAVLSPFAVLHSELPRPWAWLLAADAAAYGLWLAIAHPWIFLALLVLFLAVVVWLLPKLWRLMREVWRRLMPRKVAPASDHSR